MSDREESVWVIFNGEIYNFPELKRELEGYGHVFRTKSDTEVIIHGYKQWGDEVLNHLNGMFGLAIWDARKERLVLARDPFGIKLIYYRMDGGRVVFRLGDARGSCDDADEKAEVDPTSLNLFLRYRYTPSPYTILKGVRKLAPGTKLTVQNGVIEREPMVQIQACTIFADKVGRRSQGRVAGTLQAGGPAAADQRCARSDCF